MQYHVRYQGHSQWLSREGLAAVAAEEGGVTDAERVTTHAIYRRV